MCPTQELGNRSKLGLANRNELKQNRAKKECCRVQTQEFKYIFQIHTGVGQKRPTLSQEKSYKLLKFECTSSINSKYVRYCTLAQCSDSDWAWPICKNCEKKCNTGIRVCKQLKATQELGCSTLYCTNLSETWRLTCLQIFLNFLVSHRNGWILIVYNQCWGPGSGSGRIRTFRPDPDLVKLSGSGSGSDHNKS